MAKMVQPGDISTESTCAENKEGLFECRRGQNSHSRHITKGLISSLQKAIFKQSCEMATC
jgi:hypothetical protein